MIEQQNAGEGDVEIIKLLIWLFRKTTVSSYIAIYCTVHK
jgi:hypothetical protein